MSASEVTRLKSSSQYPLLTPNDSTDVSTINSHFPKGLSVKVAGTVAVHDIAGTTQTFVATEILPGTIYPIQFKRLLSTGTSATGIRAYY